MGKKLSKQEKFERYIMRLLGFRKVPRKVWIRDLKKLLEQIENGEI